MFYNVLERSRIFQNVLECSKMFQKILGVLEHICMFQNVLEYSIMLNGIKCFRIFQGAQPPSLYHNWLSFPSVWRGGGGRIYVIKFSRTVSIVHVMLNQGPEGQRPDYLQAVKAARPELQVNVKLVFGQQSKMFQNFLEHSILFMLN